MSTTSSSRSRFMPLTPRAPRPMARTSCLLKRTAIPLRDPRTISLSPVVSWTPIRVSVGSRVMAMMPLGRGRLKAPTGVLFTVPLAVAKKTNFSSNCLTGSTAQRVSLACIFSRLAMERPRAVRAWAGRSKTRAQ